jgi:hypothetical protein
MRVEDLNISQIALKPSLFCDVTQRMLMVVHRHFRYSLIGSNFKGQAVLEEFCPETSVNIYQHTVRNIPEERRPELHYGESVKSLRHL